MKDKKEVSLEDLLESKVDSGLSDISEVLPVEQSDEEVEIDVNSAASIAKRLSKKQWIIIGVSTALLLLASTITILFVQNSTGKQILPFQIGTEQGANINSTTASNSGKNGSIGDVYIEGAGRFESDPTTSNPEEGSTNSEVIGILHL